MFNECPSDVVETAPIVVGDVSDHQAPFSGEGLDVSDSDIDPVVLRVVATPKGDNRLSIGLSSPRVDVGLQRVRVCYRPTPLEPSAFEEGGTVFHALPNLTTGDTRSARPFRQTRVDAFARIAEELDEPWAELLGRVCESIRDEDGDP